VLILVCKKQHVYDKALLKGSVFMSISNLLAFSKEELLKLRKANIGFSKFFKHLELGLLSVNFNHINHINVLFELTFL
jgi:hypothetical protein